MFEDILRQWENNLRKKADTVSILQPQLILMLGKNPKIEYNDNNNNFSFSTSTYKFKIKSYYYIVGS